MESKKEVVGNFEPTENVKLLAEAQYLLIESNKRQSELIAQRDELLAALKRLEVASNTVSGCYTRNPANFASALNMMEDAAEEARTAITKCEVKS